MIIFVLGVIDIPASLSWRAGDALLAQVWKNPTCAKIGRDLHQRRSQGTT
jgi:hypothetical protein